MEIGENRPHLKMKDDSAKTWKWEKNKEEQPMKSEDEQEEDEQEQETEQEHEARDDDGSSREMEKTTAAEFTCFEDVLEVVGSSGRWNVWLFFLCGSCAVLSCFVNMSYQFLGVTPDYWCHVETLTEANWTQEQILHLAIPYSNETGQRSGCSMYDYNYTEAALLGYDAALASLDDLTDHGSDPEVVLCGARDFNHTQHKSSIVTEWDLVCERRFLYATSQAVNQFGFLFGSAATPIFTDAFGRRPIALSQMLLSLILGLASCLSSSAEMFIGLKLGLATTSSAVYLCCFLIVMELCSPATRSSFGSLFVVFWALGMMILPGIAYLVRPWRYLQAAFVLPYGVLLVASWLLPESPRWLLLQGRLDDAEVTLTRIAAANRRQVPPKHVFRAALKRLSWQMTAEMRGQAAGHAAAASGCGARMAAAMRHLLSPYSTAVLARRMALLFVLWFSVSFVYYGVSLNATNISADPYLYLFLGGVCEVPAYLMLWLLVARAGRRPSLSALYLLCAACIATNAALMFTMPDVSVAAKISLSLMGKMGIAAAFHLLFVYTSELFTTEQRSLALGHTSVCGRFGSVISPYINDLLGERAAWAPSAVFSAMALVCSCLALLLPETRNQNLPEDYQLQEESQKPLKDTPAGR